jgi:hypothetical protein
LIVIKDLRIMKYNKDPDLKQAYKDQGMRTLEGKQAAMKIKAERFRLMTGMTFQEKNFENMVNFYRPELIKIIESKDEYVAITDLSKSVQKILKNNEIIAGRNCRRQISPKARGFLPRSRQQESLSH